jgi:metal transporter CNNM
MEYLIVIVLIALSALFSGLTLGLMGLDVYDLERKMNHGNKHAAKIFPLREKGNLLLTSLLLGNVFVNAFLAVFLGSLASGIIAGISATALIFLFGEIIPQAVISRYALPFGAATAPLTRTLIFVLYPIVYPLSLLLDKALGAEVPNVYSRNELISIIAEHEDSKESPLDEDEERIAHGALKFSQKKVSEIMTPRTVVVGSVENDSLTKEYVTDLLESGMSRFPVFKDESWEEVTGLLYIRSLVGVEPSGFVKDIDLREAHVVDENMPLDDLLNEFIQIRVHLFIVEDEFGGFSGVVTVEDVLEEILQREIVDEDDKHLDMRKLARAKKLKNGSKN